MILLLEAWFDVCLYISELFDISIIINNTLTKVIVRMSKAILKLVLLLNSLSESVTAKGQV